MPKTKTQKISNQTLNNRRFNWYYNWSEQVFQNFSFLTKFTIQQEFNFVFSDIFNLFFSGPSLAWIPWVPGNPSKLKRAPRNPSIPKNRCRIDDRESSNPIFKTLRNLSQRFLTRSLFFLKDDLYKVTTKFVLKFVRKSILLYCV